MSLWGQSLCADILSEGLGELTTPGSAEQEA